jgi:hypothetical protein
LYYNSTHQLSIDQAADAVVRCDHSQQQEEKEKLHVQVLKFRMKIYERWLAVCLSMLGVDHWSCGIFSIKSVRGTVTYPSIKE